MSLMVVVPSRGRPESIKELSDAWLDTIRTPVDMVVAVDDDDPKLPEYQAAGPCLVGPRLRMAGTLNKVAVDLLNEHTKFKYIGFMGDDHRPRTFGWDVQVKEELDRLGTGIVYGNDLIQGEKLPTAVFMTADIVRTLGWMAPPGLIHLFLDNSWLELGRALGAITYLRDTIIEHLHPVAQKAEWDDGYREVNSTEVWDHDEAVFKRWVREDLARDVEKLRCLVH